MNASTIKNLKAVISYTKADLEETIKAQTESLFLGNLCPKLEAYIAEYRQAVEDEKVLESFDFFNGKLEENIVQVQTILNRRGVA